MINKGLIVVTGLVCQLILELLTSLISDFTDYLFYNSLGKFTKQLALLQPADKTAKIQNSFASWISSKQTTLIRQWYDVYMTLRHHINFIPTSCLSWDNIYCLQNFSTNNSLLCLSYSVVIVVAVTPNLFTFRIYMDFVCVIFL